MSEPISAWTGDELRDISDRNCPGSDWATQPLAAEVLRLREANYTWQNVAQDHAKRAAKAEAELAAARADAELAGRWEVHFRELLRRRDQYCALVETELAAAREMIVVLERRALEEIDNVTAARAELAQNWRISGCYCPCSCEDNV